MSTRERRPQDRAMGAPRGSSTSPEAGAPELRERASELLAASDRLIERALSADSARFLSQTRQSGGQ
jgi:hypothetical protein